MITTVLMTAKRLLATCACLLLWAGLSAAENATSQETIKHPNLTGTWSLDHELTRRARPKQHPDPNTTLVILHRNQEIRITKKVSSVVTEVTREFVFYDDGRGETNPRPTISLDLDDVANQIKSSTRWKKSKLIITSSVRRIFQGGFYGVDVFDEWELSSDGQTLTQTTSVKSDPIKLKGPVSVPVVIIPFGGELKHVYRRIAP